MKKSLKIFIVVFLTTKTCFSQCLKDSIFKIDSIGTRGEKMALKLIIKIDNDSVHVLTSLQSKKDFVGFAIVEIKECKWNEDFSEGYSTLLVKFAKTIGIFETPTLKIVYEKNGRRSIELLYSNKEERIFTIGP